MDLMSVMSQKQTMANVMKCVSKLQYMSQGHRIEGHKKQLSGMFFIYLYGSQVFKPNCKDGTAELQPHFFLSTYSVTFNDNRILF